MPNDNTPTPPDPNPSEGVAATPCPRCGAPQYGSSAEGPCAACMLLAARHTPSGLGASFEAPTVAQVGEALPSYEVQLLIGQGGMGAVYRARHRKLDRLVAIKVLRPLTTDDEAEAAAFTERFEREARVLAKLDHPRIVRIYDFGRTEGATPFFYLVLEFVDGTSLRELMQSGRLTAQESLGLIPQVCEALHAAHALGVVHRDIKPENILVDGDGRVRIADFGLAKLKSSDAEALPLTQTNQAFGTVHYMAPEQMRSSGGVDHRADLYSLGVVLYELLTGELPLGRFAAPSTKSGSHAQLDDVVFKALAAEPDERYQAAADIKDDLEARDEPQAGAGGSEELHEDEIRSRRLRTSRRRRALERTRLKKEYGDLVEDDVLAESGNTRTWFVLVVLLLLHSTPWVSAPYFLSNGAVPRGVAYNVFDYSSPVPGIEMSVLGVPIAIGLLALFLGGVLKATGKDLDVDVKWTYRLAHVGTVLMLLLFLELLGTGAIKWLDAPAYLALGLYLVNSWKENKEYRRRQAYEKLRGSAVR